MFSGRISVADYWKALLLLVGVYLLVVFLSGVISGIVQDFYVGIELVSLFPVILFIFVIGLNIRRGHDLNFSGLFIAIVSTVFLSLLYYAASTANPVTTPWPRWFPSLMTLFMIAWLVLSSWPGQTVTNKFGPRTRYGTTWGALIGRNRMALPDSGL